MSKKYMEQIDIEGKYLSDKKDNEKDDDDDLPDLEPNDLKIIKDDDYNKIIINKIIDNKYNIPIKEDPIKFSEDQVKNFFGNTVKTKDHKECSMCASFVLKDYFFKDTCAHCWAWLHSNKFNTQTGIYDGNLSYMSISDMLKKTYNLHNSTGTCKNSECIYNRINSDFKNNKLHKPLCVCLNLVQEQKITISRIPKRNINIDYNKSVISI
jgi:hypothetical protein